MLRRTRVTRRSFMSATALGVGALARYIPLREEWARAPQSADPWKVDMTLYDRPGGTPFVPGCSAARARKPDAYW